MITTNAELEELIDSTVTIPTIPATLMEIQRVVASPNGSAREAGQIIEKDPAIAAKVLRLVNSSFYSLRNPVTAIPLACSILGLRVIKNVVVQATVLQGCSTGKAVEGFDPDWLWDHSFKAALAARLLTAIVPAKLQLDKDDAYTCGLIHDVGKMLLLEAQPKRFAEALRHSKQADLPLARAEGELFGFNHAHVGGLLAQRWKLSVDLQEAVMYHHSPGGTPEEWTKGYLIQCANTIAHQCAGTASCYRGDVLDDDSLALLDVPADKLEAIRTLVRDASKVG